MLQRRLFSVLSDNFCVCSLLSDDLVYSILASRSINVYLCTLYLVL